MDRETVLLQPDGARAGQARRAIAASLVAAAVFEALLFAGKETPAIYDHAPWLNDPYDTAVSFALFCIPLVVLPSALRLLACAGRRPEPASRLSDLLRAAGVGLAAVAVTLASGWAAVALGANRVAWNAVTALQIGLLAIFSVAAVACAAAIRRASAGLRREEASARQSGRDHDVAGLINAGRTTATGPAPDWLADLLQAGFLLAGLLGPAGRPLTRMLRWLGDWVLPAIRRHPVAAAALIGLAFAVPVTTAQSVNEGYRAGTSAAFFVVVAAGVFAFVAAAGSYLRLVRHSQPSVRSRPVVHATVLACAAVPAALAFRAALWSLAGANPQRAGLPALWLLLASAAAVTFGVTLTAERLVLSRRPQRAG